MKIICKLNGLWGKQLTIGTQLKNVGLDGSIEVDDRTAAYMLKHMGDEFVGEDVQAQSDEVSLRGTAFDSPEPHQETSQAPTPPPPASTTPKISPPPPPPSTSDEATALRGRLAKMSDEHLATEIAENGLEVPKNAKREVLIEAIVAASQPPSKPKATSASRRRK